MSILQQKKHIQWRDESLNNRCGCSLWIGSNNDGEWRCSGSIYETTGKKNSTQPPGFQFQAFISCRTLARASVSGPRNLLTQPSRKKAAIVPERRRGGGMDRKNTAKVEGWMFFYHSVPFHYFIRLKVMCWSFVLYKGVNRTGFFSFPQW